MIKLNLKKILADKGINQKEAAEITGLSENTVSKLVGSGLRQIRIDTIDRLCEKLEITPAELFILKIKNGG